MFGLNINVSSVLNIVLWSQVPEMDETYAEDSFVVGNEVEEPESSEEEAVELMPEDSYVDGKRQYATRRRVFLHKARAKNGAGAGAKTRVESLMGQKAELKTKRARVIRVIDSSEEETEDTVKEKCIVTERDVAVALQPKAAQLDSDLSKQKPSSSSSSTLASKISLLSKGQRGSVTEDQQNER